MPKSVAKIIERTTRSYLWSVVGDSLRDHLVGRDGVGKLWWGLGISNLYYKNMSLLVKWLWRFLWESNYLLHRVIKNNFICIRLDEIPKLLFQGHKKPLQSYFQDLWLFFREGDSSQFLFREDCWFDNIPVASHFPSFIICPRLIMPSLPLLWSISMIPLLKTCLSFRNLNDWDDDDIIFLLRLLDSITLSNVNGRRIGWFSHWNQSQVTR